jgi:N6-L-threonylcarbamoyladenine synthase
MPTRILGIESSCDETAAAVVADGCDILSSVVASQVDIHRQYGGVVPELASREHLRNIVPVVREALGIARMTYSDIDAVGVTFGPGLVGALLVGLTYGKTLALALGKPLLAVNHLEGHVRAVFLEAHREKRREPELPAVCLIVSGGHTVIYEITSGSVPAPVAARSLHYRRLGQTRDDAAGEAYDKVARLLGLGYPGGPIIDQLAAQSAANPPEGVAAARPDSRPEIRFRPAKIKDHPYDFSFSGIKTAVLYYLRAHPELNPEIAARRQSLERGHRGAAHLLPLCGAHTLELLSSFQRTVVAELVGRTLGAAQEVRARSVLISGGVAANSALRYAFVSQAVPRGLPIFFPSRELSTDNAAMIAAAAYPQLLAGDLAGAALNAEPVLPLS